MPEPKRRIMRKLKISEISAVDNPAQARAKMLLMKRDEPENYAKALFNEALAELQLEDRVNDALSGMWELDSALRRSIREIIEDEEEHPDTMAAIKQTLQEFVAAVSSTVAGALGDINNETDEGDDPDTEEKEMKDDKTEKVEVSKADFDGLNARVERAEAIAKMNSDERSHFDTLSADDQTAWLAKSDADRTTMLKSISDGNQIVYTDAEGTEYRKNDDPRLVAMAKRSDADREIAKADRERAENAEFAKRAQNELQHLPGDEAVKVAVLKAVSSITDADIRSKAEEMLKASNTDMAKAMERLGTSTGNDKDDSPLAKLNALAKKHQEANSGMSFEKAYTEVIKTDEGKALYNQTQA